jgi:hypothetical protein
MNEAEGRATPSLRPRRSALPRRVSSPAHLQSARWAVDRFAEWRLANPHLEPFEFGRGWQLECVSMPGVNAIKDFDAYHERTRHTNADYPERTSEDDLKQSAIVMATFAWQAARADERIPRRP